MAQGLKTSSLYHTWTELYKKIMQIIQFETCILWHSGIGHIKGTIAYQRLEKDPFHLLRMRVSFPPWSLSFGECLAFCLPIYSGTGHSLLLGSRGGIIPCRLGGRFQLPQIPASKLDTKRNAACLTVQARWAVSATTDTSF